MNEHSGRQSGESGTGISRRRVLQATTASFVTVGLAGCSNLTNQEFTAEAVTIPEQARSELGYTEQRSEEETITKSEEVAGVDLSATIETHYATYAPTDLESQEFASGGERPATEQQARKEALFAGLRAAGEEDLLTLPSMAAVSTPKGEVFGQQLNPLANRDMGALLESNRAEDFVAGGGGGGSDTPAGTMPSSLDWRRDPEEVDTADVSLVGTDAELRAFGGLVEGSADPLFLLASLTRAVEESVIITAGTLALPVSDPERDLVGDGGYLTDTELETVLEGAVAANEAVELA